LQNDLIVKPSPNFQFSIFNFQFAILLHLALSPPLPLSLLGTLTIARSANRFTPTMKVFFGTLILLISCGSVNAQSGQSPLAPPKLPAVSASGSSLKVGVKAPDFALPNGDGKLVVLSEYTPKSPVVLVFYRGFW